MASFNGLGLGLHNIWQLSNAKTRSISAETPTIHTPLGDICCNVWYKRYNISSLHIAVNPAGGFNSYWEIPFRKSARIAIENLWDEPCGGFFYQVTYALTDVPNDAAYLH